MASPAGPQQPQLAYAMRRIRSSWYCGLCGGRNGTPKSIDGRVKSRLRRHSYGRICIISEYAGVILKHLKFYFQIITVDHFGGIVRCYLGGVLYKVLRKRRHIWLDLVQTPPAALAAAASI